MQQVIAVRNSLLCLDSDDLTNLAEAENAESDKPLSLMEEVRKLGQAEREFHELFATIEQNFQHPQLLAKHGEIVRIYPILHVVRY